MNAPFKVDNARFQARKANKSSASGLPFQDQLVGMLAQLDAKPTEVLELEGAYSDCTTEVCDNSHDISEESNLPPPLPFYDRRTNSTSSAAPVLMQGIMSRARSSSPNRGAPRGAPRGRDIFQSRAMTMSMPNVHSNRSTYNRGIGFSDLDNVAEWGGQGKQALSSRIDEFDSLLEDL
jgi:hypothetical protein